MHLNLRYSGSGSLSEEPLSIAFTDDIICVNDDLLRQMVGYITSGYLISRSFNACQWEVLAQPVCGYLFLFVDMRLQSSQGVSFKFSAKQPAFVLTNTLICEQARTEPIATATSSLISFCQ